MEQTTNETKPDGAASELSAVLEDMVAAAELVEFNRWFQGYRATGYDSMYTFALAAWKARAAMTSKCRGVARTGCNYLAPCGMVCDKCGHQH